MFRTAMNRKLICINFFPFSSLFERNSDETVFKYQLIMDKIKDSLYDQKGDPTKELQSVTNTTFLGFVTGLTLGGIKSGKEALIRFKEENQATLFQHKFFAHRALNHIVTMSSLKGGLQLGAKCALFTFLFTGISTALFVYRGYFNVSNTAISGAIIGFIFRMHMGIKAIFAASVLGSALGTVYGLFTAFLLYITGTDMNDVYESGSKLMQARRERIREIIKEEERTLKELREKNEGIKKSLEEKAGGAKSV
ncbi:unnamed protein product [Xylocopa violacea]|uniref:Complex I assembly factor TIMMDC1, mitochondrial n=1 Tax=Xylocopa violacea TaxID=135666 RepID=A0ABP1NMN2_XYLVO